MNQNNGTSGTSKVYTSCARSRNHANIQALAFFIIIVATLCTFSRVYIHFYIYIIILVLSVHIPFSPQVRTLSLHVPPDKHFPPNPPSII